MECKVHRFRYYNPKPESINCLSYNKSTKHLAVARDDASIELWDLHHSPYCFKFIPGQEHGSVEALGWFNERLFSTGLGGALVEWDLEELSVKKSVLLTGYAAWCLATHVENALLAVGTEQGYVNLYYIDNDDIVYRKLFDKQEGRIICCQFDKLGDTLVTGSVDTIRVWNVKTGQATCRMSARRRGHETIVWSLGVLSDKTIVTGESFGRLSFWDMNSGDQIESFTTHKADILSLVVSNDEKSIYCAGVDPLIVNFVKIENSKKPGQGNWVKNVQRHIHQHDVRGLALNDDMLISVGVDGYMTFSSFPPKWVMRIPQMLPAPRTLVSPAKKLIMLRYSNYLEIWKLGSYAVNNKGQYIIQGKKVVPKKNNIDEDLENDSNTLNGNNTNCKEPTTLQVTENTSKLVSLQAKKNKQIKCCAFSPDGELIMYATDSHIRMLRLEMDDEGNTSLSKIPVNGLSESTCDRAAFTQDSRELALHCRGSIHVFRVDQSNVATLAYTLDCSKHLKKNTLLHLLISSEMRSGKTYLLAADSCGVISVWSRSDKPKFEHYVTLPKYQYIPSAVNILSNEYVVVTYVDQKIVEYSLIAKQYSDWLESLLPCGWDSRRAAVRALSVLPTRTHVMLLQDDSQLLVLDKFKMEEEPPAAKKKSNHLSAIRTVPVKYLADFHWLKDDEAVIVELLPENIVAQLPAVTQLKRPPPYL